MELARSCCRPKPRPSLRSIFLSVIGLWVKIWHRNKAACSESNPVQSSSSQSTTCPRKGRLLRYESNSTATSDGGAQKLGKDVRRDSESIDTKICSQIGRKKHAMFESHVVTSVHRTSWRFFEQSAFVNTIIYCVTDQPSITRSQRSVLNFKFSVLSSLMSCSMSIEQKLCKVKIFQLQSMSNAKTCIDQRFAFKNSRISSLPWYSMYAKKSVAGGEIRWLISLFFEQ